MELNDYDELRKLYRSCYEIKEKDSTKRLGRSKHCRWNLLQPVVAGISYLHRNFPA